MGIYIHRYDSEETQFNPAYWGDAYLEPWVSYTEDVERTDYNKSPRDLFAEKYLTIGNIGNGASGGYVRFMHGNGTQPRTIEYRINGGEWAGITSTTAGTEINVAQGDTIEFRGDNATYSDGNDAYCTILVELDNYRVYGNVMSLVSKDGFKTMKTLTGSHNFNGLFSGCSGNFDARNLILPATALTESCYRNMFYGCTGLTNGPELPAATLAKECYYSMFYDCTGLLECPDLPATNLAEGCYYYMFRRCSSITRIPELPATTLEKDCYRYMFNRCFSLNKLALNLPATEIPYDAYRGMFAYCSGITEVSGTIPATSIGSGGCLSMFIGCSSMTHTIDSVGVEGCVIGDEGCETMFHYCTNLAEAPLLPAMEVGVSGYCSMFSHCEALTNGPELPATGISTASYYSMFYSCSSITAVTSELPAQVLADSCYRSLFNGCTSLAKGPDLRPETLSKECYMWMFNNSIDSSSGLSGGVKELTCRATGISVDDNSIAGILQNTSAGTLYINPMSSQTDFNALAEAWWRSQHASQEDPSRMVWDVPRSWSIYNPYTDTTFKPNI